MVGFLSFGWIADHAGHRLVIIIGMLAAIGMNVVAFLAGGLGAFVVVFVFYGIFNAAIQVSALNATLEFAPTAAQRPTYIGIDRTTLAPFGFGFPLLGGFLVDAIGYHAVFGLGAAFGVACVAVLLLVRDPRHRAVSCASARS